MVSLTELLAIRKVSNFLKNFVEWLLQLPHHFKQECNDPLKNDTMENLDDETMTGLKEMGAFGLQVLRFLIIYHGNKQKVLLLQLYYNKNKIIIIITIITVTLIMLILSLLMYCIYLQGCK